MKVGSLLEVLMEAPGPYVRVTGLLQNVPLPMQKLTVREAQSSLGLAGSGAWL